MKKVLLSLCANLIAFALFGQTFYFGHDLSYTNQMEDCGAVFKEGGQAKDVYQIFADQGTNLVRVRLWVDPSWQNSINQPAGVKSQYSDFEDVKETIRRAKDAGMQVLLGIHYSDVWADPGRQLIPSRWLNIATDTEALKTAVYNYTTEVLTALNDEGLMPDIVKIGNENNAGILYHTTMDSDFKAGGSVSTDWGRHAQLYNAAIKAVREVGATASVNPKIALHYSGLSGLKGWYKRLMDNGVTDFDIIGFSYYYSWHEGSIAELGRTIRDLVVSYPNYETMVVETGYLWSTGYHDQLHNIITTPDPEYLPVSPEKQLEYMVDYTRAVMKAGGTGVIFWEPAWVSTPCSTPWGTGSAQEHVAFFEMASHNFMENGGGRWTNPEFYQDIEAVKVTFKVNMSGQDLSNGVYITGDFTGEPWQIKPMLDEGGNIYSYVTYLSPGATGAYYFLNGNDWNARETVPAECATNSDRAYTIPTEDVLIAYKWASCEEYGPVVETASVTFKVDMTGQDVSNGVFVTGNFTGDPWQIIAMTEEDGENIYSYTTDVEVGTTGAYVFRNVNNWDDTSKENVPKDCAPQWGTHREYSITTAADKVYAYKWASCESIVGPQEPQTVQVTFKVDMRGQSVTKGVYVTGDFTGENWKIIPMEHVGGGTFAYTATMEAGTQGAYFFLNGNDMAARETVPAECATMGGKDRGYQVADRNVTYEYSWASCELLEQPPLAIGSHSYKENGKGVYPNPAIEFVTVDFTQLETHVQLEIYNHSGQSVLKLENQKTDGMGKLKVDLNNLPAGFYLLKASAGGKGPLYGKFIKE